jgi:hypothetical protein
MNSRAEGAPRTDDSTDARTNRYDWREQRRAWREERREARYRRPWHGLFFGLTLLLLGSLFLLNQAGIVVGNAWWQFLLLGLGAIFIVDWLAHFLTSDRRMHWYGGLVIGTILMAIGAIFLLGFGFWWPLAVIAGGVAVLTGTLLRR